MKRYPVTFLGTALGITLGLAVACSSNSDEHAPMVSDGGAPAHAGAGGRSQVGKSGSGGTAEAGSTGENDDGGMAGAAGSAGYASDEAGEGGEGGAWEPGMVVPVKPGACSETATWPHATPLEGISTDADEQLLAITPDELDILFLRDGSPMSAHRDLASTAFGAADAMTIPDGYGTKDGVALSSDGKTLVLLATSGPTAGQSFAAFTRPSRSAAFDGTADATAFAVINQRAIQTGQHYAAPILAPDGKSFVFSAFTPIPEGGFPNGFQGVSLVYEAVWTESGWTMPESISMALFDGSSVTRALPSGLASDSRTLFYFDEGSGKQMARFRDRPDSPLYGVVELDTRKGAVPDAPCDRLYYSSGGDVLVAAE